MILEIASLTGIGTTLSIIILIIVIVISIKEYIDNIKSSSINHQIISLDDLLDMKLKIDDLHTTFMGCIKRNKMTLDLITRELKDIKQGMKVLNGFEPDDSKLDMFSQDTKTDDDIDDFIDRFKELLEKR